MTQASCILLLMIKIFFLWCFSYFIDHATQKTTWEDPRKKKPEAIPMNQFKVMKLTI